MQRHRFAGRYEKRSRVAPDLAALAVHPRLFVIMAEHGAAPLLVRETEIGK